MAKRQAESAINTNKVFQVLLKFSDHNRKRFHKYMRSPYFVQSPPLLALYEAFLSEIDREQDSFAKEKIWEKIYEDDKYDDVRFRKLCSDLLKYAEDFMAHESLVANEIKLSIEAMNYVAMQKIDPLYKSIIRESRTLLTKTNYKSFNHFHLAYQIDKLNFEMTDFEVKVDAQANFDEISTNLDIYYWIEKLKIGSLQLSQKGIPKNSPDLYFINKVISFLSKTEKEENLELATHYFSFLTLYEEDNTEHYYKLKHIFEQNRKLIPQKEALELIDSALHYCTRQMNKGNRIFLQEYFELFEKALLNGLFIVNGELATWRFNNAIGVALKLGNLSWAERFIQNYSPYLPADSRENTYSFNLARVYRYQKKFESVLGLLRDVDYQDIGYNLISKTILAITYYELGQHELLSSFLTSFRLFLDRNKKVPYREIHLNLIKYTRRLIRLNFSDQTAVSKLREEITREKANIVNHEWLLEKLA